MHLHVEHSSSQTGSFLEIGRSHKERSLVNTMSTAAAASPSHWESQPLSLQSVYWHYQDEEKGHRFPTLGCAGIKLPRPSGDRDAHTSPQSQSICPQEEWWRNSPIFQTNRKTFSSVRCMVFSVLGEGTDLETARPLTASWCPDHIDRSKFHHLSWRQLILNCPCWTFAPWPCTTQP